MYSYFFSEYSVLLTKNPYLVTFWWFCDAGSHIFMYISKCIYMSIITHREKLHCECLLDCIPGWKSSGAESDSLPSPIELLLWNTRSTCNDTLAVAILPLVRGCPNKNAFETITDYMHFAENPTRFGSVVTKNIWIFVRYVISPFHPSFDSQQTHTTSEFHSPVEWFMQIMYKTWMESTHEKKKWEKKRKRKKKFFVTTEPNRMGFSAKCRELVKISQS